MRWLQLTPACSQLAPTVPAAPGVARGSPSCVQNARFSATSAPWMSRLRQALLSWLIVLFALASLTIGVPLHEARHLAEPLSGPTTTHAGDAGLSEPAPGHGTTARDCVWCLFHAQAALDQPPPAAPALLRLAFQPPTDGLRLAPPAPAQIRAAPPRGPPQT